MSSEQETTQGVSEHFEGELNPDQVALLHQVVLALGASEADEVVEIPLDGNVTHDQLGDIVSVIKQVSLAIDKPIGRGKKARRARRKEIRRQKAEDINNPSGHRIIRDAENGFEHSRLRYVPTRKSRTNKGSQKRARERRAALSIKKGNKR